MLSFPIPGHSWTAFGIIYAPTSFLSSKELCMSKAKSAPRVFALLPLKVNPIESAINVYMQIY